MFQTNPDVVRTNNTTLSSRAGGLAGHAPRSACGKRHARQARGFSLIELLVVMFIIALLLGILLPVLPKARDAGKRVACSSNLRNVGQVIELYKNDFKEKFPLARYMPPPFLSGEDKVKPPKKPAPPLNTALAKYIDPDSGESKVYKCPGDKIVFDATYTNPGDIEGGGSATTKKCGMSYTYMISLGDKQYEKTFWYEWLKKSPTDTPVAYDFDGGTFETRDPAITLTVPFFHATRNVLFVDGHVGKYGKTSG